MGFIMLGTQSNVQATTAILSAWAAGFRLEDAPAEVVERIKALVLDHLRVVAVGARLPWSRATRALALELGGHAKAAVAVRLAA